MRCKQCHERLRATSVYIRHNGYDMTQATICYECPRCHSVVDCNGAPVTPVQPHPIKARAAKDWR